jgi:lipopolysaccharide/colanic/teichoic acid biosynthesis glycosyltransferase
VKRLLDVVSAAVLLVVLSPLLLVVAVAIALSMGTPVIFRQARPGLGGRVFTMYKFRTMRSAPMGATLEQLQRTDADRTTQVGRFLRSTSMDELPELVNVLLGQMSVVGPRPLLPEYLEKYNQEQARRHDVRPGITGWAQVNGRNAISWDERLKMDVWYVDNRSLILDARILLLTISTVLGGRGTDSPSGDTPEPFSGSSDESNDWNERV